MANHKKGHNRNGELAGRLGDEAIDESGEADALRCDASSLAGILVDDLGLDGVSCSRGPGRE